MNERLRNVGITVMDGSFFSIMPFGKTNMHSLTFTPHIICHETLPTLECQKRSHGYCTKDSLGKCNECLEKTESAWTYMSRLAQKYLRTEYQFEYVKSLFSMKPILKTIKTTELDDSRPTVIRTFTKSPTLVSVLSGKINTVYDLDEMLENE